MFPRFLFLFLLALCIGGACWIAFAPEARARQSRSSRPASRTRPAVRARRFAREAQADPGSRGIAINVDDACMSIGPFSTQSDMRVR